VTGTLGESLVDEIDGQMKNRTGLDRLEPDADSQASGHGRGRWRGGRRAKEAPARTSAGRRSLKHVGCAVAARARQGGAKQRSHASTRRGRLTGGTEPPTPSCDRAVIYCSCSFSCSVLGFTVDRENGERTPREVFVRARFFLPHRKYPRIEYGPRKVHAVRTREREPMRKVRKKNVNARLRARSVRSRPEWYFSRKTAHFSRTEHEKENQCEKKNTAKIVENSLSRST